MPEYHTPQIAIEWYFWQHSDAPVYDVSGIANVLVEA
jgi:hypothetical protein